MKLHSIGTKIIGLGMILILMTVAIFIAIVWTKGNALEKQVSRTLNQNTENEIKSLTQSISQRTEGQFEVIQKKLISDLNVARKVLERWGGIAYNDGQKEPWSVVNQFTKEEVKLRLARMLIGQRPVQVSKSPDMRLPVVDEVSELVGATCTIFQRMNPEGDMLRVLTNVMKTDGQRAIGTYIPALNPDGSKNVVVSTVLKGETYYGKAYVVNQWYLTAYEPIKDADGQVTGILYVGVALEEQLAGLKKDVAEYVIGKTGYIYVLDSKGHYIVSRNNERNGESIQDIRDADGRFIIREIIKLAKEAKEGQVELIEYAWQNKGENEPRMKMAAVTYFKPLDWVIGAGAYVDELNETTQQISRSIAKILFGVLTATAMVLLLGGLACYLVSRRIANPINRIADQADLLSRGEIEQDENERQSLEIISKRKDELGSIAQAFKRLEEYLSGKSGEAERIAEGVLEVDIHMASASDALGISFIKMTEHLNSTLGTVKSTAAQVAVGSEQISNSSHILSEGASEQAASMEQITSSMEQMAELTRQNADTAHEAHRIMEETLTSAEEGGRRMEELVSATQEIDASSREIAKIIKVIDDIAFQTNLLALNAAVEAARAGVHGKGFAVVAQEVRNLAGRSAKAARETAELIESSLKNMEKETVAVDHTAERLRDILEKVNKAGQLVEDIHTANQNQAEGIRQINTGLDQIESVTQHNSANAEQTASSSEQLAAQAALVQDLMSRFRLKENGRPKDDGDSQEEDKVRKANRSIPRLEGPAYRGWNH